MDYDLSIESISKIDDKYQAIFRYWEVGQCACTGIKLRKLFDFNPTVKDLLESI